MSKHYATFLDFASSEITTSQRHAATNITPEMVVELIGNLKQADLPLKNAIGMVIEALPSTGDNYHDINIAASRLLELALRIWLGLDVRLGATQIQGPYATVALSQNEFVQWTANPSLPQSIALYFDQRKTNTRSFAVDKLDPALTMEHLVNNCDFIINWTWNLADHLTVDCINRVITVYEHKISLVHALEAPSPIPHHILEEALDTLNLLFPFESPATKLLQKYSKPFYGLGRCGRDRCLDAARFTHWRAPLAELSDVLREPAAGFRQLRLDRERQNLMQILTFWVAAAVAFLAVVTFVFGVVATVYAKRQYDVGVLQYRLVLAQACAVPGAGGQLPGFCS